VIEQVFGSYFGSRGTVYYLLLYFLGMIVADIPSLIKYRNNPAYNSLGASGAVSAVVFSSIIFYPTARVCVFVMLCLPGFIFAILYLLYSYYQGKRMADHVNHDAHFYGALFGVIFSLLVSPSVIGRFFEQVLNFSFF
jgi:membrane associated rhomboid family serine protease